MNVVVDGLMASYQKVGKGKTLVFLHGWGDSGKTFSKLIENLQDKYTILALDLPGFGGTQVPKNAWGLEDYAQFIRAWLAKINAGETYAYVGHSYGGAAAIAGLASGTLKADKLVLLASAGVRNKYTLRKRAFWLASKAAKIPLAVLPEKHRRKLRNRVYKTAGSDMMLLPHMELTFKRIIKEDVQIIARSIKQPTLLIYGTKDKETPLSYGQALAKAIPNSYLEVMPGLGHFLHQEEPQRLAEIIRDFLEAKND